MGKPGGHCSVRQAKGIQVDIIVWGEHLHLSTANQLLGSKVRTEFGSIAQLQL